MLQSQIGKGEIAMVLVDMEFMSTTIKHRARLLERANHGEELLFDCCAVALWRRELAGVMGNRTTILHDDGTKL